MRDLRGVGVRAAACLCAIVFGTIVAFGCGGSGPNGGGEGGTVTGSTTGTGTGSEACGQLQATCTATAPCCDGLACPGASSASGGSCCSLAGGACNEDYDCCFGKCSGGQCGCSSVAMGEGCTTSAECCNDSPDHLECASDPATPGAGTCAFTGSIVLTTQSCQPINTTGSITHYCVTLSGVFEGPVGATQFLDLDPSTVENTPCGPANGCPAWKGTGCSRLAADPDKTEFSFSYMFGSDVPVAIVPRLGLQWTNGGTSVEPTLQCGP